MHQSPGPRSKLKNIEIQENEKQLINLRRKKSPDFVCETDQNVFVSNPTSYGTSPQNRSVEATPTKVVLPKS